IVNTMAALRDLSQRQEAERALGQRLSDILGQPSGPPKIATTFESGRDVEAPEFLPEPTTRITPAPTIGQTIVDPRSAIFHTMRTAPGNSGHAATMLSQALEPRTPVKVGAEESLIDPRTNQVVYQGLSRRQPHVIEVFDPTRGRNVRRVFDLNQ